MMPYANTFALFFFFPLNYWFSQHWNQCTVLTHSTQGFLPKCEVPNQGTTCFVSTCMYFLTFLRAGLTSRLNEVWELSLSICLRHLSKNANPWISDFVFSTRFLINFKIFIFHKSNDFYCTIHSAHRVICVAKALAKNGNVSSTCAGQFLYCCGWIFFFF